MRLSKMVSAGCMVAGLLVASGAAAEDPEFSVKVTGNSVTVTPNGKFHVNTAFPWKLTCGSTVIRGFSLTDKAASVSGGTGTCDVHGGVCNGPQCVPVDVKVTF